VLRDLLEQDMEELTIYLARNARNLERALKGKEPVLGALDEDSIREADKAAPLAAAG
jgi:dsDNA-binding SOS-regulon protein